MRQVQLPKRKKTDGKGDGRQTINNARHSSLKTVLYQKVGKVVARYAATQQYVS